MLNGPLLEKLGGTVKKLLDDKDTAAADGGALQQLAERDAKIAELEAEKEGGGGATKSEAEGEVAALKKQLAEMASELEAEKKKKGSQPMMKGSQPMTKGSQPTPTPTMHLVNELEEKISVIESTQRDWSHEILTSEAEIVKLRAEIARLTAAQGHSPPPLPSLSDATRGAGTH